MKSAAPLLAILFVSASTFAATNVLYETGWEPAPASPAWALGAITGQNGWLATSASGFQVVSNGSPGAIIGGQPVTTPYGTQFGRLVANPSTTGSSNRFAWPDISGAFANRAAGQNLIRASFDVYVPSVQADDSSWYGVRAFHETTVPWGLFVEADDHSVNLVIGGSIDYVSDAFTYDTWFNVAVIADYSSGALTVEKDGKVLPLSGNSPGILSGSLQDVDLWSLNPTTPPTLRAVFIDNYRVTAAGLGSERPTLKIEPGAVGEWHLSWNAVFWDWILESTQDLGAALWTNEGVTPSIASGVASVDLTEAPPRTLYRLRKP